MQQKDRDARRRKRRETVLEPGNRAPSFHLLDQRGKPVRLGDFYPKDLPSWRGWHDDRRASEHSEHSVVTCGSTALLYGAFCILEN